MLIATGVLSLLHAQTPRVVLNGQDISGKLELFTYTTTPVEAFLGIPYAEPPVGALRFRKPLPLQPNGAAKPLNASRFAPRCWTLTPATDSHSFSEDCLYLNVWRPYKTKSSDRKAVIVVVHGDGNTNWGGGALAAVGDVIVVNFDYRQGVFGFLDVGNENVDAPGHQGHMDQYLLLQWVQSSIRAFGGDPTRVTVSGQGTGSLAISAHMISPVSQSGRRLFHAAVLDGEVLTSHHVESVDESWQRATQVALAANCTNLKASYELNNDNIHQVLSCLRSLDASELVELQQGLSPYQRYTFRPTFPNAFLGDAVLSDLAARHFSVQVPILIGDSAKEGTVLLSERNHSRLPDPQNLNDTLEQMRLISESHGIDGPVPDDVLTKSYHLKDGDDPATYQNALIDFASDMFFICPVTNFMAGYSLSSMAYHYFWTRTTVTGDVGDPSNGGAYHGIGFDYMMGSLVERFANNDLQPEDIAYSMDAMEMLAAFAKSAKQPAFRGVTLPPYDVHTQRVFVFSEVPYSMKRHPKKSICDSVWTPYFVKSTGKTNPKDEF